MAQKGRVFELIAEHDFMHAETLLYMLHNLDPRNKQRLPSEVINYKFGKSPIEKGKMIQIPEGTTSLGIDFHETTWGWDNEFPKTEVKVPAFKIDALPVTNSEFLQFVESEAYNDPKYWTSANWMWKCSEQLNHPHTWEKDSAGKWMFRTVYDSILMEKVLDWPVYVSQAEASAYAKWKGKRLPTEAEFVRAAYGKKDNKSVNKYPWGEQSPQPGVHGNFNMYSYAPIPVGTQPNGKSEFGVYELVGNGWEWTSTIFDGFPGFEAWIPKYPGYSADFFDGEHFVMLGASWATAVPLVRRSFRNWFQSKYQFTFTKFRCVVSGQK